MGIIIHLRDGLNHCLNYKYPLITLNKSVGKGDLTNT